jgi:hypothetical protein
VYVNGDEAFVSNSLADQEGKLNIYVPLNDEARTIELRVDPIGGSLDDHAAWGSPEFIFEDQASADRAISLDETPFK